MRVVVVKRNGQNYKTRKAANPTRRFSVAHVCVSLLEQQKAQNAFSRRKQVVQSEFNKFPFAKRRFCTQYGRVVAKGRRPSFVIFEKERGW